MMYTARTAKGFAEGCVSDSLKKSLDCPLKKENLNGSPSRKYEKPVIIEQIKMTFPMDIMEATGKGVVCKQCSSCHSCR